MSFSFLLVQVLTCYAFYLILATDDEITVDVLNPSLASSMNQEIKSMEPHLRVKYIGILGKLAFYARLYRAWISQPSTAKSGFVNELPKIHFSENVLRACNRGFMICVDNIWSSVQQRNSFIFSEINEIFKINAAEVRRFINNEMFDFDFSAIYVFCWMTTNGITLLKHLPFCDGKHITTIATEMDINILDDDDDDEDSPSTPIRYWPSKLLSKKVELENGEEYIAIGILDPHPYRCATERQAFCVNGCNQRISPCPANSSCYFRGRFNEDISGMLDDNWNVSCSCPQHGYIYRFDVNECVDINECMYESCEENEQCVNTKGSFRCICQLGFIPVDNICKPVRLRPTTWSGPAVSSAYYHLANTINILILLNIIYIAKFVSELLAV
ncbi:Hemicentin-2 [Toxocara canis]|uniref:Hemicentin-2 n=1 Tax=Toxocara canis TaxID=6265 RepID=A0A0B2UXM7_TOXCA|nr:Hemicentin-2 [Toxocara canis]